MAKKDDFYHSVLIVSSSEQFGLAVKKTVSGYVTLEMKKSVSTARRCILERYYDLVLINVPLPDETGVDFAMDVTEKCNASVLLVVSADTFESTLDQVTDRGVLVIPKPIPRGRLDKAIRYLIAMQNRIHGLEKKIQAAEEKNEELRIVNKAKFLLIEKKRMSEDEAHRFIGKKAMDNGISRGKAAQKILDDYD
ncbi:MAG: ANTAR domain-containing protein [Blautia sp.]|nr:ANTAR domain-containing protein [Blautia sp.]